MCSTANKFLCQASQARADGIEHSSVMLLQSFLGIAVMLGTCGFGLLVVRSSVNCMIARQYLCQASSFLLSATLLTFTAIDDYSSYVLFVWIYGFFYGGYQYALKMFIYEKVRARNFNGAWGFAQFVQSVPILVGVPLSGNSSDDVIINESIVCIHKTVKPFNKVL